MGGAIGAGDIRPGYKGEPGLPSLSKEIEMTKKKSHTRRTKSYAELMNDISLERDRIQVECQKLDLAERRAQYKRNAETHALQIKLMKKELTKPVQPTRRGVPLA